MAKRPKLTLDNLQIETRDYVTIYTFRPGGTSMVRVVDDRVGGTSTVSVEYLSVDSAGDPAWRPCNPESLGSPHLARDSVLSELLQRLLRTSTPIAGRQITVRKARS